ncbi:MAG: flavodoxin domain-containing protein, partial [Pseudomonadota bacterium]
MSTTAPLLPETAPFSPEQIASLNAAFAAATRDQRLWLQGFLAGYDVGPAVDAGAALQMRSGGAALHVAQTPAAVPAPAPAKKTPLTLLYASESGNAEALAAKAKKQAQKLGFDARVIDMADAEIGFLSKAQNLVVYAATWGEGDPPERARDFYDALMGEDAPQLGHLSFAVLGLGDSAYVDFCETGKRIDARLEQLGAKRAAPRIDLDLDFAAAAKSWTAETLETLKPKTPERGTVVQFAAAQAPEVAAAEDEAADGFDEAQPLEAGIIERVNLNGSGSTRETWHVELATDVPGFVYQPGDSIGVVPENDPATVDAIMTATGVGDDAALAAHLRTSADITTLSVPLLAKYADLT